MGGQRFDPGTARIRQPQQFRGLVIGFADGVVEGDDLGDPADWLGEDGPSAAAGATAFAVFITPRDDKPELGSIVCILDEDFDCEGDEIALPADGYTRLSILALADPDTPPTLEEGYDRLVTTHSFDPGLVPAR